MRASFPRGWVWVGAPGDDDADEWTCCEVAVGAARTTTIPGRTGTPALERRCVLQHAWQTGTSASYACLGATLLPNRDQLRIEVVSGRPLGGTLVDEILAGALAGAGASERPGVLRFDRARVLVVDLDPALYHRAARVFTQLLGSDLAVLSEAALGERTAALWSAGDGHRRGC